MNIDRIDLERAAGAGLLTREQAGALWDALSAGEPSAPASARRTLAGVAAAGAVVLAFLAVLGLQRLLGLGPVPGTPADSFAGWLRGGASGLAAFAAAAVALRFVRTPLLSAVLALSAWLVVLRGAPLVFGPDPTWNQVAFLSSLWGLVAVGAGVALDGRARGDHAFWLYLAGLVALWGALATFRAGLATSIAGGALANAALVAVALLLRRRIFAVFGAVGLAGAAGHLAAAALVDEALPFAYAFIGLAVGAAAVAYPRAEAAWSRALLARLPGGLRLHLPPARRR